ncbi:MAG TPA: HAD-IIIA family hydrolase [Candidatus Krumholzibacteria bacterium]|nr:HAD-IIIA family hydrolase [Candidatus Krumholzibacteria bacterium]
MNHRAVVWLDRDGTIVDDPGYLRDPLALRLLPGAGEAVSRLNRAGIAVVLVTNQSGIARGLLTEQDLRSVHAELRRRLASSGAHLDAIRHCPHLPDHLLPDGARPCACRKPRPGMIEAARDELGVPSDTPQFVVGDKPADVRLARAAGCRSVLVLTGEGRTTRRHHDADADLVVPDVGAAVSHILEQLSLADGGPSC